MFSLRSIIVLLIFIVALDFFITINHLYWLVKWLDMPMHFLGGFWVGMVFLYLNQKFFKLSSSSILGLATISFIALIGVLWEFMEFFLDVLGFYGESFQLGLADTLSDLFFGLLGGLGAVIVNLFLKKEKI